MYIYTIKYYLDIKRKKVCHLERCEPGGHCVKWQKSGAESQRLSYTNYFTPRPILEAGSFLLGIGRPGRDVSRKCPEQSGRERDRRVCTSWKLQTAYRCPQALSAAWPRMTVTSSAWKVSASGGILALWVLFCWWCLHVYRYDLSNTMSDPGRQKSLILGLPAPEQIYTWLRSWVIIHRGWESLVPTVVELVIVHSGLVSLGDLSLLFHYLFRVSISSCTSTDYLNFTRDWCVSLRFLHSMTQNCTLYPFPILTSSVTMSVCMCLVNICCQFGWQV